MNQAGREPVAGISPAQLAFDIDGVVADTFRSFIQIAREEYGVDIPYENITDYEFWRSIHLERENIDSIIRRILEDPLGTGMQPIRGAVSVLTRLSRMSPVRFVTARTDREAILEWVRAHLKGADSGAIRLEAVGTHEGKQEALIRWGINYFVEDRLETCFLLRDPVRPIVFDQPWNRKPHPFPTVRTWDEISSIINW